MANATGTKRATKRATAAKTTTRPAKAGAAPAKAGAAQQRRTPQRAQATASRNDSPRTATVNLPFVSAEFRAPNVHLPMPHLPSRDEVTGAMNVARANLPTPERLAFYAGLGVLAVIGAIEWPVAAAIGVGTVIAQRAVARRRAEG